MERIEVVMIREHMEDIPYHPVPEGFRPRKFKKGERSLWTEIEASVNEFSDQEEALSHFKSEFGDHLDQMEDRSFFLEETKSCRAVGTVTAWYNNDFRGLKYGRLHWVAIHPDFQGLKLGKPLVSLAMRKLAEEHRRAYLTSQTTSYKAINMYLDFGFIPLFNHPRAIKAWKILADRIQHPLLVDSLKLG